jgi:hypothetical protein
MEFNPNTMKKPVYNWATYIPNRRGSKFKVHKNLGHAKSAFQYRNEGIIYEFDGNEWVEVYRLEKKTEHRYCDWCNKDTLNAPARYKYYSGQLVWSKVAHIDQIYLCYDCKYKHYKGEYPPKLS